MKLTKKKVFVAALAVCLIAILSLGSLAWFTAEDDVENKFNFATSGDPAKTDFDIDVYEIDKDGTVYDSGVDEDGITYNNILPGDKLVKKAFVKNTSTTAISATGNTNYSQFVRATVTIKEAGLIKGTSTMSDLDTVNAMLDFNSAWSIANCIYDAAEKAYVVVLYGNDILDPAAELSLFTTVTVPTWIEVEDVDTIGASFSISVKAEAVQSDNIPYTNAKDAFVNLVD